MKKAKKDKNVPENICSFYGLKKLNFSLNIWHLIAVIQEDLQICVRFSSCHKLNFVKIPIETKRNM